jgi:DNA-directed RNA polymerase alpha subunit
MIRLKLVPLRQAKGTDLDTLGLSVRTYCALRRVGYRWQAEVRLASDTDLLREKGIGVETLREVRDACPSGRDSVDVGGIDD